MARIFTASRLTSTLHRISGVGVSVGVGVWLGVDVMLGVDVWIFVSSTGPERPSTGGGWILWLGANLVLFLLLILGVAVVTGLFYLTLRVPPLSWVVRWVSRGEDAIDRMLRVGLLAIVFLGLFLVVLRLIFGPM